MLPLPLICPNDHKGTLPKQNRYRRCRIFSKKQSCVAPKQAWHEEMFSLTDSQVQRQKSAQAKFSTNSCGSDKLKALKLLKSNHSKFCIAVSALETFIEADSIVFAIETIYGRASRRH